jgi:protein SCO1/2
MNNTEPTDKQHLTRLFLTLAVAALCAGLWVGYMASRSQSTSPPMNMNATLLPQPKTLHPFQLIDHNQQPFGTEQLQGQWTFIFFGYTHCPDVCPAALFMFQGVHKQLQGHPDILKNTRFTLVSVDPQRDTPQHLGEYVHYYHPDFIGITGEEKEIRNLSRQVGAFYMRNDEDESDNYQVDHSASILLFDPLGRLYSLFSPPHQSQSITSDYLAIRNYYEENPS